MVGKYWLQEHMLNFISQELAKEKVAWLIKTNGCWNMEVISFMLPCHIGNKFYAHIPFEKDAGKDQLTWLYSENGVFLVRNAYRMLTQNINKL